MNNFIKYLNLLQTERLCINPPRGKLLFIAFVMFITEFILIAISSGLIYIVTMSLLAYWIYFYIYFSKIWTWFHYSKIYIIAVPILVLLAAIVLGFPIRAYLSSLIDNLFFRRSANGLFYFFMA